MSKLILLLLLFFTAPALTVKQSAIITKVKEANACLARKDYVNALKLFKTLHQQVDRKNQLYAEIAPGYATSIYYSMAVPKWNFEWRKIIDLSNEFLKILHTDKEFLGAGFKMQTEAVYENIIIAYSGLGQREKAKPFQEKLYEIYKSKQLINPLRRSYYFEIFECNSKYITGSEFYAAKDKSGMKTDAEIAPYIYFVNVRTAIGEEKLLYALEVLKFRKIKSNDPDYILTKVVYATNGAQNINETLEKYTFTTPLDYDKLHTAVLTYLKCKN